MGMLDEHRLRSIGMTGTTEASVWAYSRMTESDNGTRLGTSAKPRSCRTQPQLSPWWDLRQYVEDYTSGNVGLNALLCGLRVFDVLQSQPGRHRGGTRDAMVLRHVPLALATARNFREKLALFPKGSQHRQRAQSSARRTRAREVT